MRIVVDFQTAEDDRIWALASHVRGQSYPDELSPGSLVLLDDTEGRTASAVIETVESDGLLELRVIWETWQDSSIISLKPLQFGGYVGVSVVQNPHSRTSVGELIEV
jgi:hypothetical protein